MHVVTAWTPEQRAILSAHVARWVADQIPHMAQRPDFGPCAAIGVADEDGALIAGCVFHNYFPEYGGIEISCAAISSRWLTKSIIGTMLGYPFDQLGVVRLTAITPLSATSVRRFLNSLGFVNEGVARSALGPGQDAQITSLLSNEWAVSRFNPANGAPRAVVEAGGPEVHRKRRRRRKRGHGGLNGTASAGTTGSA